MVDYPDSGSDEDVSSPAISLKPTTSVGNSTLKRKHSEAAQDDLPPLPAAFHDLYTANARVSTSDNPSLHGGRKRAIPHVDGNWPSHVYLECKDASLMPRQWGLSALTCARDTFTARG